MAISLRMLLIPLIVTLIATAYQPVLRRIEVLGVLRHPSKNKYGATESEWATILGTPHCEDLHYHGPSGKLFTACDDDQYRPRFSWFPPVANFDNAKAATKGSIQVIDPETMTAQRLILENFDGPFVTHGIDILTDPEDSSAIYIYTINHRPNDDPKASEGKVPKARSQVELFRHVLGTNSAKHIRSIRHDLVFTPNDIYATSPGSFYITNDHLYRDGILRQAEDLITSAKWSNIIHVDFSLTATTNPDQDVKANIALSGEHNFNGMGHINTPDSLKSGQMIFTSAASGILFLAQPTSDSTKNLTIHDRIFLPSTLDNPTYYSDPYASTTSSDASGFILAGLMRASVSLGHTRQREALDPGMVWHVKKNASATANTPASQRWITKLIFEDDGSRLRFATTGLMVPIDPAKEGGKKMGRLFVTGVFAENIVAVKIEL